MARADLLCGLHEVVSHINGTSGFIYLSTTVERLSRGKLFLTAPGNHITSYILSSTLSGQI